MKTFRFSMLFVFMASLAAFAGDRTMHNSCRALPMKGGSVVYNQPPVTGAARKPLTVSSANERVFSLNTGEVTTVMTLAAPDSGKTIVLVKYAKDAFIAYSNLKNVAIKKGDKVTKGQVIGAGAYNNINKSNEVYIQLFNSGGKVTPVDDPIVAAYIQKADN